MIVFLDFDGVLHSFTDRHAQPYRDLQRLEAVLREYPAVSVVVSSSQREEKSLDELRAPFSPDIAPRVVGVTPVIPIDGAADLPGSRYREILLYLDEHPAGHWVALDDDETLFPLACPNLILCEDGFNAFAAMELQARLKAAVLEMFDALDGPDQEAIPLDSPEGQEMIRQARATRPWLYDQADKPEQESP